MLSIKRCLCKLTFVGLLALLIMGCKDSLTPIATPNFNGFDTDEEGWQVRGGFVSFSDTGGNPGGYIRGTDNVSGFWYFIASPRFVNEVKKGYGKTLSFDLEQSATDSLLNADDIALTDGMSTLTFNTAYNPKTTWTSYAIKLDELSGWKKGAATATQADIQRVLQNLTELRIRGEFRAGPDHGGLDNVAIQ